MHTIKTLASSALALLLFAGSAAAVTVKNESGNEISIGIDYGAKEEVKNIAGGKSATFDCTDGCGVTGPWGFSWMAKGNDTFTTDGKSLVSAESAEG